MLGWDHTIAYPSGHQQMSAYASLVWDLNSELLTKSRHVQSIIQACSYATIAHQPH